MESKTDIKILVVEDNEINREVAVDILKPLNMIIDTAQDGEEAIRMITQGEYDLVFMDYLMPVMDGAKATSYVRNLANRDDLKKLPIVALTASTDEVDFLLGSGMDDCIIKPMTLDNAKEKLLKYIPDKVIGIIEEIENKGIDEFEDKKPFIEGIDVDEGIKNCGSLKLLKKMFLDYANIIDFKHYLICDYLRSKKYDDFMIEVHALKSSSLLIGAVGLSKQFEELERLTKAKDIDKLNTRTEQVLNEYRLLKNKLLVNCAGEFMQSIFVPKSRIVNILENIIEDSENMYLDGVDSNMHELNKCVVPKEIEDDLSRLRVLVTDVDLIEVVKLCKKMIGNLGES